MQQIVQGRMLIGIDVHKDTHTAVGVSPFGEKMFELTVGNYQKDFVALTAKVEAVARDAYGVAEVMLRKSDKLRNWERTKVQYWATLIIRHQARCENIVLERTRL